MTTTVAIITTGNILEIEEPSNAPVFQNMLDVSDGTILPWGQDADFIGPQITWHTIAPTYAIGYATDTNMVSRKLAVMDLDNTNARDAITITGYVNNLVDDLSALTV